MSEWWTYRLSDFLMFSAATYWRMVERYNRELWPLQLAMLVAGIGLLWLVAERRPWAGRVMAVVLAGVWAWVGWAFHWARYAQINWAADYFAAAFWLQAALLLAIASIRPERTAATAPPLRNSGLALMAIGVLLYPFAALASGRPWGQAEVFGLMPEPTALVTLGCLIAARPRHWAWLAAIPFASLMVGLATWSML